MSVQKNEDKILKHIKKNDGFLCLQFLKTNVFKFIYESL